MATINVEKLELKAGKHKSAEDGMCLLELTSYLSPESDFTDHPKCVSPVLGQFGRSWNDALGDADRQMLKPYAVKLLDTASGKKDDETRAWMLTDWLARECAPAFLRAAGLTDQAEALEALSPLTNAEQARKAEPVLAQAREDAAAAGGAAWGAAGGAARAAAWAAARDAAGDAAWDAAGGAAGGAAGAAAAGAAWAAARDAAWDAAWAAARAAAWDAAGGAAWGAAGGAAWDALAPTVEQLQASALFLLDRMIEVGKPA